MTTKSEFIFIYTTVPDEGTAKAIAANLVNEKLAACVNIYPPMTSVYEWEGKLETAAEVACLIKTRKALTEDAMATLRKHHPYDVPAMLVLPIVDGNDDYLDWVRQQTNA
jgi:periplasmic divalent cation tolerance protein